MFIIVALVYKSALSLCENPIAVFRRTGSRKTFFWMYADAETRIWFRTPARVRSRVVSPCGYFKESGPREKDQRWEQRGELLRVRGPDRQQLWPAAPSQCAAQKTYISRLTKYLSTGRKNTTFDGIKTVQM